MKRSLVVSFVLALSLSGFAHAQCAAFPCVVASVSLTNQSHAIPMTTIFTPTTSGLFRISAYISASTGHQGGAQWQVQFGWTDDIGTRKSGFSGATSHYFSQIDIVASDVGGQPLVYMTRPVNAGEMTYNLYITVEQLQ